MKEFEPELLESELRKLKPAPAPAELMARLTPLVENRRPQKSSLGWPKFLMGRLARWFAPATALVAGLLFLRHLTPSTATTQFGAPPRLIPPMVNADNIEVAQKLVATFDAVARLPDGQPVRFRCSEWFDDVVLHDSSQGILIQHRVPRLEVKQVSFETY